MSNVKNPPDHTNFAPEGWHTVTPKIVVNGARQMVEFLQDVFEATGEYLPVRPSVIKIDDSVLMIGEAGVRGAMPALLYVYISDTDARCQRAVAASARVIETPFDTPYGDRRCMVEDKWGNTWQIATQRW